MREYTALRDVDVMDGKDCLSSFSVRYTFAITAGVRSRNWTNAADGDFHPAEDPTVEILKVETCWYASLNWHEVKGEAFDMLTADVPDAWFIQQATEAAQ